jgi:hypothetical protein
MTSLNPYAPPKANVEDVREAASEEEVVRREHIKHETSVRSIGTLYYLSGGLMLLVGLAAVTGFMATTDAEKTSNGIVFVVIGGSRSGCSYCSSQRSS